VLVGGILLLATALWARQRRGLIAGSLGGAVLLPIGCQGLAEVTGLADSRVQPGVWQAALVLGML
jgi:hypothetical protein